MKTDCWYKKGHIYYHYIRDSVFQGHRETPAFLVLKIDYNWSYPSVSIEKVIANYDFGEDFPLIATSKLSVLFLEIFDVNSKFQKSTKELE